jgi:hypothetical protein
MRRCPNVITLDATVIDASGVIVPTDVSNSDLDSVPRGYEFADIYAEDGPAETASTGSAPDNVVHIHGETVAGHLAAELVADPAPTTGTVTVIFGSRLYGGA